MYIWVFLSVPCLVTAFAPINSPFGTRQQSGINFSTFLDNHVLFMSSTATLPEGVVKTVVKDGNGPMLGVGDVASVRYSCYLPEQAGALPFAKSKEQKVVGCELVQKKTMNYFF